MEKHNLIIMATILFSCLVTVRVCANLVTTPPRSYCSDTSSTLEWSKTFGGSKNDVGESVQITSDGGYIIVGYTYSFGAGESDVYLIKTDSEGNMLWNKTYGGPKCDAGRSVQETSDGGYIIAGYTHEDVYLIKTDSEGNLLWNTTYGGPNSDEGQFVQITSDGGYIIVGSTKSFRVDADVYLIKTDREGNMLWNKTYGGSDEDRGKSVQVTGDGGFIIVGSTKSFGSGKSDVYLIKTDSEGNMLWSRTYGGSKDDWGYHVKITGDSGYVISGFHVKVGEGGAAGGSVVYLIKTDSDGKKQWIKTYDGATGYSVHVTEDGGYIIVGEIYLGLNRDIFLIRTDSDGRELWSKNIGGPLTDVGKSIQVKNDGGCIIAGRTDRFSPNVFDVYLVRTLPLSVEDGTSIVDKGVPIYSYVVLVVFLTVVIVWFLQKRSKLGG